MTNNVHLTLGCARFLEGLLTEKVESGTFTSDHAKEFYAGRLTEIKEAIERAEAKTKEPEDQFKWRDIFDPLTLSEAKARGVCRICRGASTITAATGPFVFHFGTEYAHQACLDRMAVGHQVKAGE